MEKSKSLRKKVNIQNSLSNQYSYVNSQEYRDKFNMFSLDLQRMKKKSRVLPELSSSKRSAMESIQQKLRLLKAKIKAKQLENIQSERSKYDLSQNIMPFPLTYSMPYQMQYPYPYSPCQMGHCQNCQHCNQQKPKKKRRNKKPKKQLTPIKKLINKFRICAYAVYFSIFIKHYSQKFTQNRKKWFYDRYGKKDRGIIYQGSEKVLQKLHQLDFYQMSIDAKVAKHISGQTVIDWQEYTNTALIPHQDAQKSGKGRDTVSQYIINFIESLMQKLNELLLSQDFISEYHEVFSAGSLDMSFILDNLYLPEQVPFLFVHPSKGYLRMGYQEEIQLLLLKVMVKMVIYNFLFGVGKSKSWSNKFQKQYKLAHFQLQQLWEIARTLGIYLYMVCKDIYFLGIENISHVSNFYEVSKKFGVKQAKHLQEKFGQTTVQGDQQKSSKQFEIIKNIKNLQITTQKITKNHRLMQYKDVLKEKVVDFLTNLHQKIKKQQRDLYLYVNNMTLTTPYLILQSINKKTEKQNQTNRHLRILKPRNEDKNNKEWHKIYGGDGSSFTNSSLDGQKKSSKHKNTNMVKFNDTLSKLDENIPLNTGSRIPKKTLMQSKLNMNYDGKYLGQRANRDGSFESQQSNKINGKNLEMAKSYEMKKAFNYDSVNSKFGENRQDRLRQKFRNILVKNNPVQAQET